MVAKTLFILFLLHMCGQHYSGYECVMRIIHMIRLGKNSRILTNFIMDMNIRNNYAFYHYTSGFHIGLPVCVCIYIMELSSEYVKS